MDVDIRRSFLLAIGIWMSGDSCWRDYYTYANLGAGIVADVILPSS